MDEQVDQLNIEPRRYRRIKGNRTLETAVLAKHMAGENMTQIAKDLGANPVTISAVLNSEEMLKYVEYGRSRAVSLIPKSLDVAENRLAKNDGSMALGILRGTKVLQNEQVVNNTTNIAAFGLAQLIEQKANSEQERPTVPTLDLAVTTTNSVASPKKRGRPRKAL